VYTTRFTKAGLHENLALVISATLAAIAGAYVGNKLLKKITLKFIQMLVAIMLVAHFTGIRRRFNLTMTSK
jgi:hypothetical protein